MYNLLRMPKVQLSITLILIYLTVFTKYPIPQGLYLLFTSLSFVILFDLLFAFIRKKALFIPYSAIITGLIIALIIDPEAKWYQIAGVCAIAAGTKNFLRVSGRHIFNPAAIGLFAGGIIFSQYVAWWGVSFQSFGKLSLQELILFLILLSPTLVSAFRMRRIYAISAFILSYTIFSQVITFSFSLTTIVGRIFDPSFLFFSLVMLPEPMTSPVNPKRQMLYGASVALIAQFISYPPISTNLTNSGLLPDLFIPALLLGNLLFFKFR